MCRYDFGLHGTCGHMVVGAVVEYCEKAVAPATTFSGGLRKCHPGYQRFFFLFFPLLVAHTAILSEVAFH